MSTNGGFRKHVHRAPGRVEHDMGEPVAGKLDAEFRERRRFHGGFPFSMDLRALPASSRTGRTLDFERARVGIEPVAAQLMMTLRCAMTFPPVVLKFLRSRPPLFARDGRAGPAAATAINASRARVMVEAAQVRGAVFGDDDVCVHAPERDQARSPRPARRCGSPRPCRRRRQRDDAQAPGRPDAAREIRGAARPRHQPAGAEFRIGLPVEIDFERRIDRDRLFERHQNQRRMGVGHRQKTIRARRVRARRGAASRWRRRR